jgi:hypothetical protein
MSGSEIDDGTDKTTAWKRRLDIVILKLRKAVGRQRANIGPAKGRVMCLDHSNDTFNYHTTDISWILSALNQGLLHQYQSSHSNNHTKMTASTPFNYWANNIFAGFKDLISSLHIMSHFIFTLHSHTPLPPPYHPSPPTTTISTITASPLVAVLTLSVIFASAPCSRRQMITSRCLILQAQWRGVYPYYTHHHHTTNTTSTTVRQSIHHHKHTT